MGRRVRGVMPQVGHHKPTGMGRVRGRHFYVGRFGSPEAQARYLELMVEHGYLPAAAVPGPASGAGATGEVAEPPRDPAASPVLPVELPGGGGDVPAGLTLGELCRMYLVHLEQVRPQRRQCSRWNRGLAAVSGGGGNALADVVGVGVGRAAAAGRGAVASDAGGRGAERAGGAGGDQGEGKRRAAAVRERGSDAVSPAAPGVGTGGGASSPVMLGACGGVPAMGNAPKDPEMVERAGVMHGTTDAELRMRCRSAPDDVRANIDARRESRGLPPLWPATSRIVGCRAAMRLAIARHKAFLTPARAR